MIREEMRRLAVEARFHMSERVVDFFLAEAGETDLEN